MLRTSQADVARLGDNTWYAFMTAHGLGAFLGWAGFSVMGFALWVLVLVGFRSADQASCSRASPGG